MKKGKKVSTQSAQADMGRYVLLLLNLCKSMDYSLLPDAAVR